jgi:hypothetical protein
LSVQIEHFLEELMIVYKNEAFRQCMITSQESLQKFYLFTVLYPEWLNTWPPARSFNQLRFDNPVTMLVAFQLSFEAESPG